METINQRIAKALKDRNISMHEMEKKLCLGKGTLTKAIKNDTGFSHFLFIKITKELELNDKELRWVIYGDTEVEKKKEIDDIERLIKEKINEALQERGFVA